MIIKVIKILFKKQPPTEGHYRVNHTPYMTKTLRKTIVRRFQFETKCFKTKTQTDLKLYRKQKIRKYYESLDGKNFLDSSEFWKKIKCF